MSSDIKKTIVDKKLADYGLQEEKPLVIEDDIATFVGGKPKAKAKKKSTRKTTVYTRATTKSAWEATNPVAKTPSAYSKPVVQHTLLEMRKAPKVDKGKAFYDPHDWREIVATISRYVADVAEGGGFIYKGSQAPNLVRQKIANMLAKDFFYLDEETGEYCDISFKVGAKHE